MKMPIDCHIHMWRPEHISQEFIEDSEKIGRKRDDYSPSLDRLKEALKHVDKGILLGMQSPMFNIPNEYIRNLVDDSKGKLIGFAGINPWKRDAVKELGRSMSKFNLKGLKLHLPHLKLAANDKCLYPIYREAQELAVPVVLHAGISLVRGYRLQQCQPIHVDDVALDFPELTIIIAHVGRPWEEDTLAVIRRHQNLYADVSTAALYPVRFYQTLKTAEDFHAEKKLLFGSDFPFHDIKKTVEAVRNVNKTAETSNLPRVKESTIHGILETNIRNALNL